MGIIVMSMTIINIIVILIIYTMFYFNMVYYLYHVISTLFQNSPWETRYTNMHRKITLCNYYHVTHAVCLCVFLQV